MSDEHQTRILKILGHHPGKNRAIGAGSLLRPYTG